MRHDLRWLKSGKLEAFGESFESRLPSTRGPALSTRSTVHEDWRPRGVRPTCSALIGEVKARGSRPHPQNWEAMFEEGSG
jgi:hypothetical protein